MKQRMNRITGRRTSWSLNAVAAAVVALAGLSPIDADALGLGRLAVQSSLGEVLRAEIDVSAITPEEAASLRARIAAPEAFRAAGVEFNAALSGATVTLQRRADGRPYLRVVSERVVQEPFVDVIVELEWSSGRLVREFTMLFDPPRVAAPPPAPAPVAIAPAPIAPVPRVSPPAVPAPTPVPATAPRATPASAPKPVAASPASPALATGTTAASGAGATEYVVQQGDTLSRIASRTLRPGVSLDQMLVALYRSNSAAFLGENMNRLKAGAVLEVPSADAAGAITSSEARQVIQAQSADFDAYRARLAGGVPAAAPETGRAATGKVQAEVQDRKTATGTPPDKLTLSKGATASGKPAEDQVAKAREQKDSSTRVAELSKNVEDLKKLQGATTGGTGSAASSPKPGIPAALPAPVIPPPAVAAKPEPAPAPAPVAAPVATASAVAVPPPAEASAVRASEPTPAAKPVTAETSAPVPAPAAPAAAPTDEGGPGFLDDLLQNPLLPGVGLLAALLAGFGFYRVRQRNKRDSGETSFLESRLQPDSFFGASGGQRVDTRDATGVPSSMSYSLSQLDAIGDVDPVAEADVYLAYGRDLQAEEILKEAMRATPERMAIRLKLLEVYAKRRDTKGFELLATQLYALSGGQGEDWAKAQQFGASIDSENPLYMPGGRPAGAPEDGGAVVEPLGASTMPQSVLPTPSRFEEQRSELLEDPGVDLDLDVSVPGALDDAPRISPERTQPVPLRPDAAPSEPSFDFELPAMSLDLPGTPVAAAPPAGLPDLGNLDLPGEADADEGLSRKMELADEFRQIGDTEGARDLLQEVVAQSSGALKAKAEGMLKDIA